MKNKGISLIVLIITIIIMIILAGAVILSLSRSGILGNVSEAKLKSNITSYKEELSLTLADIQQDDPTILTNTINADTAGEVKQYIPSITEEDSEKLIIQNGEIAYKLTLDEEDRTRYSEAGLEREIEHFEDSAADRLYTTLYINPNPIMPELLFKNNITQYNPVQGYDLYFKENDVNGSSSYTFSVVKANATDSEMKFPFKIPHIWLQGTSVSTDEYDMSRIVYFWQDYNESESLEDDWTMTVNVKKGWNICEFTENDETSTMTVTGTSIDIAEISPLTNVGVLSEYSSARRAYMGYYLSTVEYP